MVSASVYVTLRLKHLPSLRNSILLTTQKGLEPSTSGVTGRRSNQLSHWAKYYSGPSGTRTPDHPVMSRML